MKNKLILVATILSIVVSSCIVKSIHPFYYDKDVEFKTELLGTWLDSDSSKWEFSQRIFQESFLGAEKKDKSYKAVYYEDEKDTSYFNVHLFKLKEKYYLDFLPEVEDNIGDKFGSIHFIPTHSIARVEFVGDNNICFFWYDQDWLANLFEQNRIKISHEFIKTPGSSEEYILTAETSELQKFLVKYGSEINVFEKINFDSIINLKDELKIHNTIIEKMESYNNSDENDLIYLSIRKIDNVE
ncbi:MAG: hypothetical protein K9H12_11410 [Bacteroidales bacterium]|nr:hypothetical protein [Bacteroidales bacterium]